MLNVYQGLKYQEIADVLGVPLGTGNASLGFAPTSALAADFGARYIGRQFLNDDETHPLGAVVTTRAIADAFANGMEWFNTFGGNAVSGSLASYVVSPGAGRSGIGSMVRA